MFARWVEGKCNEVNFETLHCRDVITFLVVRGPIKRTCGQKLGDVTIFLVDFFAHFLPKMQEAIIQGRSLRMA